MKLYVVEITLRGREEDVEYVAREISQLKYKKGVEKFEVVEWD